MWVKAREREKNKGKCVNGAMFLTDVSLDHESGLDPAWTLGFPHLFILSSLISTYSGVSFLILFPQLI
jgi:hypothetical protein